MSKQSVRKQLTLAFGALAMLVLLVSLVSLRDLSEANGRISAYVSGPAERESLAQDISASAGQRAIAARDMVLVRTAVDRESARAMAVKADADLHARLKELKEAVAGAPDATERDRALVGAIDKVEAQYGPVALAIIELAAAGKHNEATDKMNVECRPLLASLLTATNEYIAYGSEQEKVSLTDAAATYSTQRALLVMISVIAAIAAAALGWWITRRLVSSLGAEPSELSDAAQRVAEGDLRPGRAPIPRPPAACWPPWGPCRGSWSN